MEIGVWTIALSAILVNVRSVYYNRAGRYFYELRGNERVPRGSKASTMLIVVIIMYTDISCYILKLNCELVQCVRR